MRRPVVLLALAAAASLAVSLLLAGHSSRAPLVQAGAGVTILAAGDIASCSSSGDEATANLLDTLAGDILVLGDLAYESGTATEFANCYNPTWGRHKSRTYPAPGNHEYNTLNATGYYGYFGAAAGDPTQGYYSFDLGSWHIIALNSNCSAIGGCGAGSPQEVWLRADLAASAAQCTLAFWHHPRFSSGITHGSNAAMQPFWQALYDYGADVVLVGHVHNYERFDPQTPSGVADPATGIRQFVVGTGGRSHYGFAAPLPNSVARDSTSYGVLRMTLDPAGYGWEFLPASGYSYTESGSASCHGLPQDGDGDGLFDALDNCPGDANPAQENADANFISNQGLYAADDTTWINSDAAGDVCDPDDDNDALSDAAEAAGCNGSGSLDALLRDTDGDRYLDGAECSLGSNPASVGSTPSLAACGATADPDGDRLFDRTEVCFLNSNPSATNTDGDACSDGKEASSLNGDTTVNSGDQLYLAQEYLRALGGATPLVNFDINKDGVINSIDKLVMAFNFGPCP